MDLGHFTAHSDGM